MRLSLHIPARRLAAVLLPALAGAASLAPGVAAADTPEGAPNQVIVRFKASSTPAGRERARDGARTRFRRKLRLARTQVVAVDGTSVRSAVRALERRPGVDYAEPDGTVHALAANPNDQYFGSLWGLNGQYGIRATTAWDTTTGSGQVVAVVDTGANLAHPDLAGDTVAGYDYVGNDSDPTDGPTNPNGHGTHVTGTIAATANNGIGVAGAAPGAKVMPVRVLNTNGSGTNSAVANGITYAADHGAETINLSLGGSQSTTIENAIVHAATKGAVVVAAAGNDAVDNDGSGAEYPCADPETNLLCVAAIASDGTLASFSNYGATSVDVAAPGVTVRSTYKGGYADLSGTSMATPHVSAVAALVRAERPDISPAQVVTAIKAGAVPQANLTGKVASGGRADAPDAIVAGGGVLAEPVHTPAPTPAPKPVISPARTVSKPKAPVKTTSRRACSGLHGRRLARCKLARRIKRVCGRKHGRSHRVCVKRVKALARCEARPRRTRSQRRRRAACMRKAHAIGRKKHA